MQTGDLQRKKKRVTWNCTFGPVEVEYRIWRSKRQSYLEVFGKRTGIRSRGQSRRLQRVMCDFGCEQSFARAAMQVREHYGFEPSCYAVRETVLGHARRACLRDEKRTAGSFRTLPRQGARDLIAEADGTMICTVEPAARKAKHPRQWKEMRLVAAKDKQRAEAVYGAGFLTVEQTGRLWGHCARDAGWGLESRIHVVADGAEWIDKQSEEIFGDQHTFLLDFYHVGQYLAGASAGCRPQAPDQWRKTQQRRLLRGDHCKVRTELQSHLEPESIPDPNAPVRSALRYLNHRADALDYPEAIKRELPIGSGLIESGHKHVLQKRLKLPGAAWLQENAHALAQLRVCRANRQWLALWN